MAIIIKDQLIRYGYLYSTSSRDYYSEALQAQPRPKQKDFRDM